VREVYTARKAEAQTLDSSDLLRVTATLLEGGHRAEIVRRLTSRYRYLFVDEFQDTDRIQKRIVDVFLGHLAGALVVGDTKQSLYGWRAADVSILGQMATENGVRVFSLSVSRRPTRPLLDARTPCSRQPVCGIRTYANRYSLGRHDRAAERHRPRHPGACWPGPAGAEWNPCHRGPDPAVARYFDRRPEDRTVATGRPGDIAVLFRSNWVLREYEEGFDPAAPGRTASASSTRAGGVLPAAPSSRRRTRCCGC